jgi:NAD-dependent SIR2 family protein deacetylase
VTAPVTLASLPVFEGTEAVTNCMYCGARTEFMDLSDANGIGRSQQLHHCPGCDALFILEL